MRVCDYNHHISTTMHHMLSCLIPLRTWDKYLSNDSRLMQICAVDHHIQCFKVKSAKHCRSFVRHCITSSSYLRRVLRYNPVSKFHNFIDSSEDAECRMDMFLIAIQSTSFNCSLSLKNCKTNTNNYDWQLWMIHKISWTCMWKIDLALHIIYYLQEQILENIADNDNQSIRFQVLLRTASHL